MFLLLNRSLITSGQCKLKHTFLQDLKKLFIYVLSRILLETPPISILTILLIQKQTLHSFKKRFYHAGDFSARTGKANDVNDVDNCNFIPGDNIPLPFTLLNGQNFDNNINDLHGKHLLELCESCDLRILNR